MSSYLLRQYSRLLTTAYARRFKKPIWPTVRHFSNTDVKVSQDRSVSRYPIPRKEQLAADIVQRMDEVEEKTKFLPNVFKALAHRPDEFRGFFMLYDALMTKESVSLTPAEKEMIVIATSSENNCLYCVVAHSAVHRIYTKNPRLADQIATNWRCAELSDREKAILDFAEDVCLAEPITDEQIDGLMSHGLDREDVWDVGAIAAFFAMSNRMAHLTDMRPNDEFYIMGRQPKDKK